MDPVSVPAVPPAVELAIYGYFVLVAAIGCYLQSRLWLSARRTGTSDPVATNHSDT
ncbi:hypothetical protein [Halobiforma nitratireducens]|uniref:Uncharacterized protein n=1 Tax=Halobiforma nitratireducens JCM 10879 TaxID=1227454 RepID=M0M7T6_9EURY|nr:hypothetical protein [Halobiforma nitratireducens]EMA41872.1 hypothetical protein C446_04665 [Halobiforma nitratireducens JCM 10879]